MFEIIIENDEGKTKIFPVDADQYVSIGRANDNTIRLEERNVSRKHALIRAISSTLFIEDLGSYNGTRLNGQKINAQTKMQLGDLLEIGDFHIILQHRTDAALLNSKNDDQEKTQEITLVSKQKGSGEKTDPMAEMPQKKSDQDYHTLEKTAVMRLKGNQNFEVSETLYPKDSEVLQLICVSRYAPEKTFILNTPEIVIGRESEGTDIVVDHRSISKKHAKILFAKDGYHIIDLESANGVFVNDEEYKHAMFFHGDLITLGHVKFRAINKMTSFVANEEDLMSMGKGGSVQPMLPPVKFQEFAEESVIPTERHSMPPGFFPRKRNALVITSGAILMLTAIFVLISSTETKENTELKMAPAQLREISAQNSGTEKKPDDNLKNSNSIVDFETTVLTQAKEQNAALAQKLPQQEDITQQKLYASDVTRDSIKTGKNNFLEKLKETQEKPALSNKARENESRENESNDTFDYKNQRSSTIKTQNKAPQKTTKKEILPASETESIESSAKKNISVTTTGEPESEQYYIDGNALLLKGKFLSSIKLFQKAIKLNPNNPAPYRGLGIAYAQIGSGELSYKYYKTYVKMAPDAEDSEVVRNLIKEYEGNNPPPSE